MRGKKITTSRKRKTNEYFGPTQHSYIVLYLRTEDEEEKKSIYVQHIYPTFKNLVMGLVQTYGFTVGIQNPDDMIHDCINFLYEKLHKFDENHGSKAFSYFNVVARNWLINTSRKKKKHKYKHVSIEDLAMMSNTEKHSFLNLTVDSPEDIIIDNEKRQEVLSLLEKIKEKLHKEDDKTCMNAIIELANTLDDIDIIHKKAIYLYLRDITNLNTKQLSSSISNIRTIYKKVLLNGDSN